MYITTVPNRNSPPAILLRESFRHKGKVKNRTLANLSQWPTAPVIKGGDLPLALHAHRHAKDKERGAGYPRGESRPTERGRLIRRYLTRHLPVPVRLIVGAEAWTSLAMLKVALKLPALVGVKMT